MRCEGVREGKRGGGRRIREALGARLDEGRESEAREPGERASKGKKAGGEPGAQGQEGRQGGRKGEGGRQRGRGVLRECVVGGRMCSTWTTTRRGEG